MRYKHTPIRIIGGTVYAWVKNQARTRILSQANHWVKPGDFYLARPKAGDTILFEPWGKQHVIDITSPKDSVHV